MEQFKTAIDIKNEIERLINVSIKISDNKIYKKAGKKYILTAEKLGGVFCQKTNLISRLFFISEIHSGGANAGVIYLK